MANTALGWNPHKSTTASKWSLRKYWYRCCRGRHCRHVISRIKDSSCRSTPDIQRTRSYRQSSAQTLDSLQHWLCRYQYVQWRYYGVRRRKPCWFEHCSCHACFCRCRQPNGWHSFRLYRISTSRIRRNAELAHTDLNFWSDFPIYDDTTLHPVLRYRESISDCDAQYFQGKAGTGSNATSLQNVSFSFQLSASLKNIKYVALITFSETSTQHFKTAANVQQFQSPFDSASWTCQPGSSVRNFQVQIGNENVFNKTQDYDYETFNDEFRKLAAVNGGLTHEISNGLIDLYKWSTARCLVSETRQKPTMS